MNNFIVLADGRFCGLFRSEVAAQKWVNELDNYNINYLRSPGIYTLEEIEPHTTAYIDAERAIKFRWYGRKHS